jgi:hypothetical protein
MIFNNFKHNCVSCCCRWSTFCLIILGGRGRGGGARRGRTRSGRDTVDESLPNQVESLDELEPEPDAIKVPPKDEGSTDEKLEKQKSGPKSKTWFPGSRNSQ